jgi:hypothetical protein
MAKLQSNNLTLEIKFARLEEDWIAYEIGFLWNNDLIVNDGILKKGRWWDKRKYGTFLANDYETDYLIETLKKCLSTNKSEYWEPIEPDAKIAIYPERYFPFLKDHWVNVEETGEEIMQADEQPTMSTDLSTDLQEEQLESLEGTTRNTNKYELFTIIVFVDTYSFEGCTVYSSEGISLHMIATRKDLEKFVTDLETEYNEFLRSD